MASQLLGRPAFQQGIVLLQVGLGLLSCVTAHANSPSLPRIDIGVPHQVIVESGVDAELNLQIPDARPYAIRVEQGTDLRVALRRGETTTIVDSNLGRDEVEILVIPPSSEGIYSLRLTPREDTGEENPSRVTVYPIGDAALQTAFLGMMRADAPDLAPEQQIALLEGVLPIAAQIADPSIQARCLMRLAMTVYWDLGDWTRAMDLALAAEQRYRESGSEGLAARARQLQAASMIEHAQSIPREAEQDGLPRDAIRLFTNAISSFSAVRKFYSENNDLFRLARVINEIGVAHYYLGDVIEAEAHWREAASLFRRIGNDGEELLPLGNLGVLEFDAGKFSASIETYSRVLDLMPVTTQRSRRADVLDNLGVSYAELGMFENALRSFQTAAELHALEQNATGLARSANGLGVTYYKLGNHDQAERHLGRALDLHREVDDVPMEVNTLRYLGEIRRSEGDLAAALSYHREAARLATHPTERAKALIGLGRSLTETGAFSEATTHLDVASEIAFAQRSPLVQADARLALGSNFESAGRAELARDQYEAAWRGYEAIGSTAGLANAALAQANLEASQGRLDQAISHGYLAVEAIENLRSQVANPRLRTYLLGSRIDAYQTLSALLVSANRLADALSVNERARARGLVDMINESADFVRAGVDEDLIRRRQDVRNRILEILHQQTVTREGDEHGRNGNPSLRDALRAAETQLALIESEIRRQNPRLAAFGDPELLSGDGIRQQIPSGATLVQYALGSEVSHAFVVSAESLQAVLLPSRERIEGLARKVHGILSDPSRSSKRIDPEQESVLYALARAVWMPVADAVETQDVLVAADGALHYVPFGALPMEGESGDQVVDGHTLTYVPSMSVLAIQQRNLMSLPTGSSSIAVFADPVTSTDDVRLAAIPGWSGDGLNYPRLAGTAREARAIAAIAGEDHFLAVGFEASRDNVLRRPLDHYRFVHFATHGVIDARRPLLTSLVLSQYGEGGQRLNGFLRLHDVQSLKLNADVVVLSACETALGEDVRGEGLTGLTQAFMYAGAQSVLASLWQVPDRATAELMARYYANLLERQLTPAKALREAQRFMKQQSPWRSPRSWAAFTLQGHPGLPSDVEWVEVR